MNPLPLRPPGSKATLATPIPSSSSDAMMLPDGSACRLRLEYSPRMRCGRVHPLRVQVEWMPLTAPVSATSFGQLQVRAILPGCHVVPEEVVLDPANSVPATFHVTPLADGTLKDARLDVTRAGQRLSDCPVPLRTFSSSLVLRLALLTVAVPGLWLYLTCYAGLTTPAGRPAADGPLAGALRRHLPPLGPLSAGAATVSQHVLDALAHVERSVRLGFLIGLVLTAATVVAVMACRAVPHTLFGPPITLGMLPSSPSARMRKPPPYLTPVPPEEMNQIRM
jgi:hypothetical protein